MNGWRVQRDEIRKKNPLLLQGQTGCKIYSNGIEAAFTKYPVLEPSFLYGGYPCKDLRHKFLMAQESDVTDFSNESFLKEIEVIPLPGHFFDMVGFRIRGGERKLAIEKVKAYFKEYGCVRPYGN